MNEKPKTLGGAVLWILVLLVSVAVLMVFLKGADWMSERLLQPLINVAGLVFAINLFILLPLAIFKRSRSFAGTVLYLSSFLFGLTTWFLGLLLTLSLWGTAATVIGLLFAGIGVVPMAMLATLLRGMWPELFWLTAYLLITFGARTVGTLLARQET